MVASSARCVVPLNFPIIHAGSSTTSLRQTTGHHQAAAEETSGVVGEVRCPARWDNGGVIMLAGLCHQAPPQPKQCQSQNIPLHRKYQDARVAPKPQALELIKTVAQHLKILSPTKFLTQS